MMDEAAPGFRQLRGLLGDVLWSQETNTVKGNCQRMQRKLAEHTGGSYYW